jgi:hypothetical protein
VHSVYRDVGVESFSVVPRTEATGVVRSLVAEVADFGDINESFRTTLRVIDQGGVQVLTKDIDVRLDPGQRITLTTDFTPTAYGNYTATATTYLSQDAQPANDQASTTFFAVKPVAHDLGIEVLTAEPRTGYPDVQRVIDADVSNNGDTAEDASVNFTVYNGQGQTVSKFERALHVNAGAIGKVSGNFTPGVVGSFNVVAQVFIVGGNVDSEPLNDRTNITVLAVPKPPPVDLSVDGMTTDPSQGVTGRPLVLMVLISNLGVEATDGQVNIMLRDPNKGLATLKASFKIGPRGAVQVPFNLTPPMAGTYSAMIDVEATSGVPDSNLSNNHGNSDFTVIDLGTRDAAVTSLTVTGTAICGKTFDVKATVLDKGTTPLGRFPVALEVTGNGQTFRYNTSVDVPKGGSAQALFNFTAPASGTYQFTVMAKAPGDAQPNNDAMSRSADTCGVPKTKTRTDTGLAAWPIVLLLVIVAVVGVIYYNYMTDKKRRDAGEDIVTPPTKERAYQRPRPPAQGPRPGGQRPIR